MVDASQLVRPGCAATETDFVVIGRGGIAATPTSLIRGDRPWTDIRDLSAFLNTTSDNPVVPPVAPPTTRFPLQEATEMAIAPNGTLQLITSHSQNTAIPHTSCASQSTIL